MKPVEILLLTVFGFWVSVIYVIFVMFMTEDLFSLIWIPIGLIIVTFLYILKKEKTE